MLKSQVLPALIESSLKVNVRDVITEGRPTEPENAAEFGASIACVLTMFFEKNDLLPDRPSAPTASPPPAAVNDLVDQPAAAAALSDGSYNDGDTPAPTPRRKRRSKRQIVEDEEERSERRRKHREAMVLFRLRKKRQFEDMKSEEQELQDELQAVLDAYHARQRRRQTTAEAVFRIATRREELMDQFARVLDLKESLLRENRAMEKEVLEQIKFQRLVTDELEREAALRAALLDDDAEDAEAAHDAVPARVRPPVQSVPAMRPSDRVLSASSIAPVATAALQVPDASALATSLFASSSSLSSSSSSSSSSTASSSMDDSADPVAVMREMRELLAVLEGPDDQKEALERAEKRRKHREAMVEFRRRKKTSFQQMKQQEQRLQDALQIKLREYRARYERSTGDELRDAERTTPWRRLLDRFASALTLKESLLRENRAMESAITELRKYQRFVQDEAVRTTPDDARFAEMQGSWVQYLDDEAPFFFIPVTPAENATLWRDSFARAMKLRADFESQRFPFTTTQMLGWRAERSLQEVDATLRVMRFRFIKRVPRRYATCDELQSLTWRVVYEPEANYRLYSARIHVKVLQDIDENTFISLRSAPQKDGSLNVRYFLFNSRLEYRDSQERRAVTLFHTLIDNASMRHAVDVASNPDKPIHWLRDGLLCTTFTDIPEDDSVEVEYAGYMYCHNEEQARFFMIETCSLLMRWEQMVTPPRLIKV
ncbi:hypothetical protein P43SY_010097 [Pythium insidiosum]|uniref:Uncharacterized protein n=1 Tax=Pythium insidiosum TaxID=114742 RepID=A0AAD5M7T8_PYTIN|nr:hypothetical protein P43SY_010097 [Pythium insidiosum]